MLQILHVGEGCAFAARGSAACYNHHVGTYVCNRSCDIANPLQCFAAPLYFIHVHKHYTTRYNMISSSVELISHELGDQGMPSQLAPPPPVHTVAKYSATPLPHDMLP